MGGRIVEKLVAQQVLLVQLPYVLQPLPHGGGIAHHKRTVVGDGAVRIFVGVVSAVLHIAALAVHIERTARLRHDETRQQNLALLERRAAHLLGQGGWQREAL